MTRLRIAALGSSYAAGPGIEPIEDEAAMRSSRNYAHQLANYLGADLTDLSVSGATLLNVLHEKQCLNGRTFDPQLDDLPPTTDIVTLTCGGNDLGYIGSLCEESVEACLHPGAELLHSGAPILTRIELVPRFISVLDRIHDIAPNAIVYLVEYLSIFGEDTRPCEDVALSAVRILHYEKFAQLLSQAYQDAVEHRPYAVRVPVLELSQRHALGSEKPWVEGFNMKGGEHSPPPYHPNLDGHTAIAKILYEQIGRDRLLV